VDRRRVFQAFHGLSHPGIRATRRLMSERVIWSGMSSDIAAWSQDCQQCARGKASSQPAAPIQPIPVPDRRFTHVHVDIMGSLPTSAEGFSYLFAMVNRFTIWLKAVPIQSISVQQCVDTFISTLVEKVWGPGHHLFLPKQAVYLVPVDWFTQDAWSTAHQHHSLSSAEQRHG
jgi:hypothetical protein